MNGISIKKASLDDVTTLHHLGRGTFLEAFADSNTAEDMKKYLDENFTEERTRIELSNPDSQFFIAWDDDQPIGYLKLNSGKAQTDLQEETSLEMERIYVKRIYHGKKVGQLLYAKALEIARDQHKTSIWLGVWEENPRAKRFYEKNGFTAFDKHIFKLGNDEQTDLLMRKVLEEKFNHL